RILRKRLGEQPLPAPHCIVGLRRQPPSGAEAWIGKEIDILNVNDDRIDNRRRRLGAGKLVDDYVADKIPQRRRPPVMAVGGQKPGATQARDGDRVEQTVVGLGIKKRACRNKISRPGGQAWDIEFWVRSAIDVTGAATNPSLTRRAAEDCGRT